MPSNAAVEDIQDTAEVLRRHLLAQLAESRRGLGLTQAEVAARTGLTRMTVQRAEGEAGNVALGSFLELALAVGLTPRLLAENERIVRPEDGEAVATLPENIVHRGYHHNRTRHDLEWEDRRREAALAKSWEAANANMAYGPTPTMDSLVPGHTQAQASAVATAIQWMGSEVGFDFLKRALAVAGYEVKANAKK